ncbi:aminoglycoside phosphotransferase [Bacillus sp. FJAT-27264]|uniref:phosphotransferase enzyme family protein n=1 Tax=Paenibacillus sp. (strain DSM 101736 / FJAT-27264) TaxID=1850362 RepID=UPI000807AE51|nr:phosphotransferase [Bacillus sp. FJAT-27264]OBZ14408.1 aminoglycoside phosphotransferase [Bacillus sp. FJAT-27264]
MSREGSGPDLLSHGMGTTLVRPDWAPITLEEVNQLLSYYPDLEEASELTWHSPRPFSSATIVITATERLFVKRHHHTVRDVAGLLEEHRFIRHLRTQGIPVSNIVAGRDDLTAFALDEWTYEVHRLAKGEDLYRDAVSWSPFLTEDHAYAAGEALALLHDAAEGFEAPARPVRALVSSFSIFGSADPRQEMAAFIAPREALGKYLENRSWEQDLETVFMPFYAKLVPLLDVLNPLWTHNDWHASNLLWSDSDERSGVESILDFGLADRTNAIYDLATAIERNTIEWLALDDKEQDDIVHYAQLEALLSGYESIRPLSSKETAALVAILPLVHAEFALSEMDYFMGIVKSKSNTDLAYDSFWLGHAKWFQGQQGQDLLTYLEQRADEGPGVNS